MDHAEQLVRDKSMEKHNKSDTLELRWTSDRRTPSPPFEGRFLHRFRFSTPVPRKQRVPELTGLEGQHLPAGPPSAERWQGRVNPQERV